MLTGFQSFARTGVRLAVNDIANIDITLTVGAVAESVEVTAAAPLLETQTGTLRGVVDEQRIVNLPLNGRDITQLVSVQAGVIPRSTSSSEGNAYTVNGSRQNGVYYMMDGGMNTDSYRNFSGLFPNPDAIQEFSIQKNNFTAEYGNATGAVVSVVTNQVPMSFTARLRISPQWRFQRAQLLRDQPRQPEAVQFGGTLGGPIVKNKAFFFFGYQGTACAQTRNSRVNFCPRPRCAAAIFPEYRGPLSTRSRVSRFRATAFLPTGSAL